MYLVFEVSYLPYNYPSSPVLRVLYQPVNDTLDMLLYMGILYLFYWQSMQAAKSKARHEKEARKEIAIMLLQDDEPI